MSDPISHMFVRKQPRRGPDLRFSVSDRQPNRNTPLDDLKGRSSRGPLGALQDWRQRKRLEKLWRNSNIDDKDLR
jgi:hypothetical protein